METKENLLDDMKFKLETCYKLAHDSRRLLDDLHPNESMFKQFQRVSQELTLELWSMLYLLDELGDNIYDYDWEIEIRTLLHQLQVTISQKVEDSNIEEKYFYDKSRQLSRDIYEQYLNEENIGRILFEDDD